MNGLLEYVGSGGRAGLIEYRLLNADMKLITRFWSDDAPRALKDDRHYFYSPGLRPYKQTRVLGSWLLWADIDTLEIPSCALPPTVTVFSGRAGHHLYWRLDTYLERSFLDRLLPRIAEAVGGDMASAKATQLLRVPGSMNIKEGGGLCGVVARTGRTYTVEEVVEWVGLPVAVVPPVPMEAVVKEGQPKWCALNLWLLRGRTLSQYIAHELGQDDSKRFKCPFHDDHSPSMSVNNEKAVWYCHGCRTGGDAAEFYCRSMKVTKKQLMGDFMRQVADKLGKDWSVG